MKRGLLTISLFFAFSSLSFAAEEDFDQWHMEMYENVPAVALAYYPNMLPFYFTTTMVLRDEEGMCKWIMVRAIVITMDEGVIYTDSDGQAGNTTNNKRWVVEFY